MASTALMKAKQTMQRVRERAREKESKVVATATFPIAGGIIGYVDGAYGDDLFFGLSNSLVVGVAAASAELFGLVGGEMGDRLLNVGQAGLAIYGWKFGYQLAQERSAPAERPAGNANAADEIRRQ